ncbi:chondroitinase-B domain-containing protein [Formosa sp. A9]|uniref:chondroitinase-B domain-containing protein n=1 Tax=Formosa sp. A9 TaxID=3442641 RepID=UPI003EBF7640
MKKITTFFLFLCSFTGIAQNTYYLDDPKDLKEHFYEAGDEIILKDGVYDSDGRITFMGSGTSENPIVFRAETPGGVVFSGGMQLNIGGETDEDTGEKLATGEYLVVDGFYWKGGYGSSSVIEFRNGTDFAHHSTMQNCVMDGLTVDPDDMEEGTSEKHNWVELYGTFNTVTNCSFMNKTNAGNMILVELAYNAYPEVPDGEDEINTSCELVGHTISNNYFYKYVKIDADLTNSGDSETIRIGTSSYQNVNSGTTVSNNYFVEADGENEIITNKSKNNTYINNTFRRSRGSLVLRHGSNATVDGNYFLGENVDGTGGIRIVDSQHTITNNYIQDCITVIDQAKWNNGITFLGGSSNAAVSCTSSNTSSDYQKVEDILLANNTIVNTNAPLFYNTDKGSTDPTGTVSNNLIYFRPNNANITPVISGDTDNSYNNLGTALAYTGNVYTGTTLGATNDGFVENNDIVATLEGEIYTFTAIDGKGADMGTYKPTTDDMVGYGIGACFLDSKGNKITNGDCTIKIKESLIVGTLSPFSNESSSSEVTVTANVSWTAMSNNDWITIDTTEGTGDAIVVVSVTTNEEIVERTGTVTFAQVPGGDNLIRELVITQQAAPRTNLINTGESDDPVSIFYVSKENSSKDEVATNTLDKDMNSVWTAEDSSVLAGDYKGDGEYVIYDLGAEYILDFIQFNTTNKGDAFGYQIWVSNTGTEASNFSMILPTSGDLLFTATGTTEFNTYEISAHARYVKLVGFGRFNSDGNKRESAWSAIGEIEFFGNASSLSVNEITENQLKLYPNPVSNGTLHLSKQSYKFEKLNIYDISGKLIFSKMLNSDLDREDIDVSSISKGMYFVKIKGNNHAFTKKIMISN